MNYNAKLKKNINKNYIYTLLENIDLTRGIWMIYLAGKGMSLTQLGLLETIFHITSFLMEVPTGAVADIFGRKISRISGRVLSLISTIILLAANNFLWFAISFVFTALSYNLESGAGDALIYDSLKEIGEEDKYMKISGKKEIFFQFAGIISFVVGGYLAVRSYQKAFAVTIVFGVLAVLQSFSFKEPSIGRGVKEEKGNVFVNQLKESALVIRDNPRISFLIVFTEGIMTFCTCIFFYIQNYLKADGYNEAAIGLICAATYMASAFIAPYVHRIEKRIKEQGILLMIPFVTAACLWGVALSPYHFIFFIVLMITEEFVYIAMSDYINKIIPSENRATILSFASMVFSFFMIIVFPLVGFLGDKYSLSTAFKLLGTLCSVLALINSLTLLPSGGKSRKLVLAVFLHVLIAFVIFSGCTNTTTSSNKSMNNNHQEASVNVKTQHKLTIEDIKKSYTEKQIVNITEYKGNYAVVESCEGSDASMFELYNLSTGDRDVLPVGPNYAKLEEIRDENYIIFTASGKTHINSFRDFPFEIICTRGYEVPGYDGDFSAIYNPKYFNINKSIEFGDRIDEIVSDIRSTLTGLEILFEPAKGKEREFFAGATSVPITKTSFDKTNNQFILEFLNTGLTNNKITFDAGNYFIKTVKVENTGNNIRVLVTLNTTAKYYNAKFMRIRDSELPYIRLEFASRENDS